MRARYPLFMKPWFLYVVRCADGSLYTGISTDVERRIHAHNTKKGAGYTKHRGPVTLLHAEGPLTESSARKCELAVKRLTRPEKEAWIKYRRLTNLGNKNHIA